MRGAAVSAGASTRGNPITCCSLLSWVGWDLPLYVLCLSQWWSGESISVYGLGQGSNLSLPRFSLLWNGDDNSACLPGLLWPLKSLKPAWDLWSNPDTQQAFCNMLANRKYRPMDLRVDGQWAPGVGAHSRTARGWVILLPGAPNARSFISKPAA